MVAKVKNWRHSVKKNFRKLFKGRNWWY